MRGLGRRAAAAVGLVVAACAGTSPRAAAQVGNVIYNNSFTSVPHVLVASLEVGDRITLTGAQRILSRLELAVKSPSPASADMRYRLYAADGLDGAPGSMLWDSGVLPDQGFTGQIQWVTFDFSTVIFLPDIVTFTMQRVGGSPDVGLHAFNPPTAGSSTPEYWVNGASGWFSQTPTYVGNFGARLRAVPGQGAGSVLFAGLVMWAGRRRSRWGAVA